jgi:plasmid stabilization system protein ParE
MRFEVTLTEQTRIDLNKIVDYWLDIDPELAERIREGIINHIGDFAANFFVGDIIKRHRQGVLRESHDKSYRIFFTADEEAATVDVVRIRHVKRRPLKSLE